MNNVFLIWLVIIAFVTLITKPTSPSWLKEGKTIFLILLIEIMQKIYIYVYPPIKLETVPFGGPYDFYHYASKVLLFVWIVSLSNLPVGVAEFLRRLYYKQWHRDFRKNFQYGYISTLSIYAALGVALLFALLFSVGSILSTLSGN